MAHCCPKAPMPAGEVSANTRQTRSQQQGIAGSLVDGTLVAGLVELIPPHLCWQNLVDFWILHHLRMFPHRHHPYMHKRQQPLSFVAVVAVVIAVKIPPLPARNESDHRLVVVSLRPCHHCFCCHRCCGRCCLGSPHRRISTAPSLPSPATPTHFSLLRDPRWHDNIGIVIFMMWGPNGSL